MEHEARPSLARRGLALLVLLIAGWLLLKFVIGVITGIATIAIIVLAIVALIWAMRTI
jgi:fatty acid desaturase